VAYVAVRGVWDEKKSQELHRYAALRLSSHKVPVDFIALDALPRNPTGKIERRLLRAREQARLAGSEVAHATRAS
jgi:acyl-coenzyme A synthetase/AMP-(fatty) acid ligase